MKCLKCIIQIISIIIITIGFKEIFNFLNSKNNIIIMLMIYLCVLLYILFKDTVVNNRKNKMIKKAGKEGEDKVKKILSSLNKDKYKVMNSFYLRGNNLTQELDSLIISSNGIFNIEVKNFSGDITINKLGEWTRIKNGKTETIKNPKDQIQRHHKVINDVVGKNINIVDILVIANDKSTLSVKGNVNYKVLLYRDLKNYIYNYKYNCKYNIIDLEKKILNRKTGDSSIFGYKENTKYNFFDKTIIYIKFLSATCSIIYILWNIKLIF
ncbi:nuclease-related domain-containing protein [Clostridium weizhouense]|uniref:NERD domain-containing protein n=1 Tax=Clostridium weizhouense TaxID=2859781 RepID=A0ABS7AQX9_9CLOT|nr:nuclease-related domain-containing protein [Clostridium weizhouense]MBW6409905.1 NERD domain-containing protein [Clostridium weizhouense]